VLIWNPGDGTDLFEGGAGIDTALVNGGAADEVFTANANGDRVQFDRISPAPFGIDIGSSEKLVVNMAAGNDSFTAGGDLASLVQLTVDGGAGNDTINGSNGADMLFGGDGDDFIDGKQGSDIVSLGAGDDVFRWDQGDGSDTVSGDAGVDELLFNGAAGAEVFNLNAVGDHAVLARDLGNIVMELSDVETLRITPLAGGDTIHIFDPSGTDLAEIDINLNFGAAGDGAADTITVSDDASLTVVDHGNGRFSIVGGSAEINVTGFEAANDHLFINGDAFLF
jgi:Ca2+-binding RTX toxin-like protein